MKISNEAKVGLMVSCVLLALAILTIKSGDIDFSKEGYNVKVHFRNVDGIGLNAPVMLNGLEVGHVQAIEMIEEDGETIMELVVLLKEYAKVKVGAQAYVKNLGFLGEKYVGLTSGSKGGGPLEPGAIIIGTEPADLDMLLLEGQEIASQVREVVTRVNKRLAKNEASIDRIFHNMDLSMDHIAAISETLDERLRVNKGSIDGTLAHLHSTAVNLDQFTYDLKYHPWKLLYRSREDRKKSIEMMGDKN